jgi:hypothetical protein
MAGVAGTVISREPTIRLIRFRNAGGAGVAFAAGGGNSIARMPP